MTELVCVRCGRDPPSQPGSFACQRCANGGPAEEVNGYQLTDHRVSVGGQSVALLISGGDKTYHAQKEATAVCYDPTHGSILMGSPTGVLSRWNIRDQTFENHRSLYPTATITGFAVAKHSNHLLIGCANGPSLLKVQWGAPHIECCIPTCMSVMMMTISGKGEVIAYLRRDLNVVQLLPGGMVHLPDPCTEVTALSLSVCGRWLAVACRNHRVYLVSAQAGMVAFESRLHPEPMRFLDFNDTGTYLVGVDTSNSILVWNLTPGRRLSLVCQKPLNRTVIGMACV